MDTTIPEGAPKNPFHDYVKEYSQLDRPVIFPEYYRHGAYSWVQIPEEIRLKVTDSMLNLQKMLMPTIQQFSNERNISQLQERVHKKLLVYEDQFNTCQTSCRTVQDAYVCGQMLLNRLNNQLPKHIKWILDHY